MEAGLDADRALLLIEDRFSRCWVLRYEDLAEGIVGAFLEVYTFFGHGFLEKVYENALCASVPKSETKPLKHPNTPTRSRIPTEKPLPHPKEKIRANP